MSGYLNRVGLAADAERRPASVMQRQELRLMRGVQFMDCPDAMRANRRSRVCRPVTFVRAESALAGF